MLSRNAINLHFLFAIFFHFITAIDNESWTQEMKQKAREYAQRRHKGDIS
jgi:hypothetical protein